MLYRIFHVIVKFSLKIYFRKIEIHGLENVVPGKAQILASNHPSGFLEPLIMACFFPRPLYFLVRGDVFENRFLKPILVATHQLPIYRFRDGFAKLRENKNSIDFAGKVLLEKKCILIFAEGSTKSVKMLRPLQKGFVRLAADSQQKAADLDIEIVPVGINFSDSTRFKGNVMIRVEAPVAIDKSLVLPQHPENTSYNNQLIANVHDQMLKNVIHLENQSRARVMDDVFTLSDIKQPQRRTQKINFSDENLKRYQNLARSLDDLDEDNFLNLKESLKLLKKELKKDHLTLESLAKPEPDLSTWIKVILGFLPALAGMLIHVIPLSLAYWFAKSNVKSREFYGSIWFVSSIVCIFLFYLILLAFILLGWLPWYGMVVGVGFGVFLNWYYELILDYSWNLSKKSKPAKQETIKLFHKYFPQS